MRSDAAGADGTAERNMYGCTPCPKCGGKYRWPTQPNHPTDPNTIICDDCGHKELTPQQRRKKKP